MPHNLKKIKHIIGKAALACFVLASLFSQPLYADDRFDALIGVYRGTYTNNNGINSMELLFFKNGDKHQAVVLFTAASGYQSQISGSYLANILYNASINQFEIVGASGINMPAGWELNNFRGSLNGTTFSGVVGTDSYYNSNWPFSVNKIDKSNYRYAGPHDHVAGNSYKIVTPSTCSRAGIKAFNCVFCGAEAKREEISRLPHTPTGNWITTKESTCSEHGIRIKKCRDCGAEAKREEIPRLPHTPTGNWVVVKEPLCQEPGLHVQFCTKCNGEAISETIPPLTNSEHVFEHKTISGNIFIPPIVREEVCKICGFIGVQHKDYSFAWVPVLLLLGLGALIFVLVYRFIKNKFVCPFCIRDYSFKEVLYVCPDCGERSVPGFLEKEPIKCKKAGCGSLATQRKCPQCSEEIPKTALETPNLPFSIIGVSGSGKTNYITVMLHELGKAHGLSLSDQNAYTREHQAENYKLIYEKHIPPESTEQTAVGTNLTPQIWRIKNRSKKRGGNVPTYTFTIFDGAGEDYEHNLEPSSTVCRYINSSKAIILVLDPLILSSIRKGNIVDADIISNSLSGRENEYKDASQIVSSVARYIKQANGIDENKILPIPVAIVLTKFDTILNHSKFNNDALVKNSSSNFRNGKVNMEEIRQVDQEIRTWLEEIDESKFIGEVEANFKTFYFFGVSSLGEPPTSASTLNSQINPHRVLDPILWLFKMAKFID